MPQEIARRAREGGDHGQVIAGDVMRLTCVPAQLGSLRALTSVAPTTAAVPEV